MTKLENKLKELGYEFVKPRPKWNDMVKRYVREFEHTIIEISIGSPSYPEFDDIYIGLPEILRKKQVLNEINAVYNIAVKHQKILKDFGLEFDFNMEELENDKQRSIRKII